MRATKLIIDAIQGISNWLSINSNSTLAIRSNYITDTSSGALTLTIPQGNKAGDQIVITDKTGSFSTNSVTLTSAAKIKGLDGDYVLNLGNAFVILIYIDSSFGWQVIEYKADSINNIMIDESGIADKFALKYDSTTGSFVYEENIPITSAPVLSGSSSETELTDATITITNYNASTNYVVSVPVGSYVRTGATITWTLPEVSMDYQYQMSVTASDPGKSPNTSYHSIVVVDIPELSGPSSKTEQTIVDITISNYKSTNTYDIVVSHGSAGRTSNIISWTLPNVTVDTPATLTVTSNSEAVAEYNLTIKSKADLSGDDEEVEGLVTVITIDNYDVKYTYQIDVTGGSTSRTGNEIEWTLPSVSSDTTHTLTLTQKETGFPDLVTTYDILVTNAAPVADTALVVEGSGFNSFVEGGFDWEHGSVKSKSINGAWAVTNPTLQESGDGDWTQMEPDIEVLPAEYTVVPTGNGKSINNYNSAAVTKTAVKKIGTASGYFNGSTSALIIGNSTDWDFGSGDFTIDCWIRTTLSDARTIVSRNNNSGYGFQFYVSSGQLGYLISINGTSWYINRGSIAAISTGQDYHVAMVRESTNIKIYVNGTLSATDSIGTNSIYNPGEALSIGSHFQSGTQYGQFYGYIDEFRVSKGIARWTANFTPSTTQYATDSYTKLLLHMDGVNDGTTFIDDSVAQTSLIIEGPRAISYDEPLIVVNGDSSTSIMSSNITGVATSSILGSASIATISEVTCQQQSSVMLEPGKIFTAYSRVSNKTGFGVVGTLVDDTLTYGTPTSFRQYVNYTSSCKISDNKVLIAYRRQEGYGCCFVATISGSAVSFAGSEAIFSSNDCNNFKMVLISDNKVLIVFKQETGLSTGVYKIVGVIATISGSSVTFGSTVDIDSTGVGSTEYNIRVVPLSSSENTFLCVYRDDSSSGYIVGRVFTHNGSAINSVGSENNFVTSGSLRHIDFVHLKGTKYVLSYYDGSNYVCRSVKWNQASSNFTVGTAYTVHNSAITGFYGNFCVRLSDKQIALLYKLVSDSKGYKNILDVLYSVRNNTSVKKFGKSSCFFNSYGNLVVPHSSDFEFGTSNFTIEMFFYPKTSATPGILYAKRLNDSSFGPIVINRNGTNVTAYVSFSGSSWSSGTVGGLNIDQWNHIAFVRNGSDFKLYVNGTGITIATDTSSLYVTTSNIYIGSEGNLTYPSYGYLDEYRVSNTARYTGNFTPPTAAFTPDANTKLLLHMDGENGDQTFIDSSSLENVITENSNETFSGSPSLFYNGTIHDIAIVKSNENQVCVTYKDGSNANALTNGVLPVKTKSTLALSSSLGSIPAKVFTEQPEFHSVVATETEFVTSFNEQLTSITGASTTGITGDSAKNNLWLLSGYLSKKVMLMKPAVETVFRAAAIDTGVSNVKAIKLDTNKVCVVYKQTSSTFGYAIIGDISGDTITWGTPYAFSSVAVNYLSVTALSATKFCIAYTHNSISGGTLIGTVDGTAISFGTLASFVGNNNTYNKVVKIRQDRVCYLWYDSTAAHMKVRLAQISGTSISFLSIGLATTLTSANYIDAVPLDDNRIVVVAADTANTRGKILVIGHDKERNTMIVGPSQIFTVTDPVHMGLTKLDNNRVVVCFSDGASYVGTAVVATISDYSVLIGAKQTYNSGITSNNSITTIDTNRVCVVFRDQGNSSYGTMIVGRVNSDRTITWGNKFIYNAALSNANSVICVDTNRVLVAYADNGTSDYGYSVSVAVDDIVVGTSVEATVSTVNKTGTGPYTYALTFPEQSFTPVGAYRQPVIGIPGTKLTHDAVSYNASTSKVKFEYPLQSYSLITEATRQLKFFVKFKYIKELWTKLNALLWK